MMRKLPNYRTAGEPDPDAILAEIRRKAAGGGGGAAGSAPRTARPAGPQGEPDPDEVLRRIRSGDPGGPIDLRTDPQRPAQARVQRPPTREKTSVLRRAGDAARAVGRAGLQFSRGADEAVEATAEGVAAGVEALGRRTGLDAVERFGRRERETVAAHRERERRELGDPESGLEQGAKIAGRIAGEGATFVTGGLALSRGARGVRVASLATRGTRAASAGQRVARAARVVEKPATWTGRAARNLAAGAPIDAAQSMAGRHESTVGAVADLTDSPTLDRVADSSAARVAADVAIGAVAGTVLEEGVRGAGHLVRRGREALDVGDEMADGVREGLEGAGAPEPSAVARRAELGLGDDPPRPLATVTDPISQKAAGIRRADRLRAEAAEREADDVRRRVDALGERPAPEAPDPHALPFETRRTDAADPLAAIRSERSTPPVLRTGDPDAERLVRSRPGEPDGRLVVPATTYRTRTPDPLEDLFGPVRGSADDFLVGLDDSAPAAAGSQAGPGGFQPRTPPKAGTVFQQATQRAAELPDDELAASYRRTLRAAIAGDAAAAARSGEGVRVFEGGGGVRGVVGTGAGSFERGRLTQADHRLTAYDNELRRRGADVPHPDDAFRDVSPDDLPLEVRDEFQQMRTARPMDLVSGYVRAEEAAERALGDPVAQVRRGLYAAELRARGLADQVPEYRRWNEAGAAHPGIVHALSRTGAGAVVGGAVDASDGNGDSLWDGAAAGAALAAGAPRILGALDGARRGAPGEHAVPRDLGATQVVDEAGQPRVVYHGSSRGFTKFAPVSESDANGLAYGPSYYFTEDAGVANTYARTTQTVEAVRDQIARASDALRNPGELGLDPAHIRDYLNEKRALLADLERRADGPNVRPARLAIERPFYIDRPVEPAEAERLLALARRAGGRPVGAEALAELLQPGAATQDELYIALVRSMRGNTTAVKQVLEEAGYDGITHMGGGTDGNPVHRVWIAFDRTQIRSAFGPPENAAEAGFATPAAVGALARVGVGASAGAAVDGAAGDDSVWDGALLGAGVAAGAPAALRLRGGQAPGDAPAGMRAYPTSSKSAAELVQEYRTRFDVAPDEAHSDVLHLPTSAVRPSESTVDEAKVRSFRRAIRAGRPLDPILVDSSFAVRDGHHRLAAAEAEGVPVVPGVMMGEAGALPGPEGVAPEALRRAAAVREAGIATPVPADPRRVVEGTSDQPAGAPLGAADADGSVSIAGFALDPAGERRLRDEVARIQREEGIAPGVRVTHEEVQDAAAALGLKVDRAGLARGAGRLSGVEMLAIRNTVSNNLGAIERITTRLETGAVPMEEAERLQRTLSALGAQNDALLGRFVHARTQTGRDLNSLKILANRTADPVVWLAQAKRITGDTLLPEDVATRISSYLNRDDRAGLVTYLASLRKATRAEKAVTVWKAGLLTATGTHIANALGNTTMAALETLKDNPAAVFDWMLALRSGVQTKHRTTRLTLRASARGARQGVGEAVHVLRGMPLDEALRRFDIPKETHFESAILDTYVQGVFRLLGASDRVFRGVALHRSLAEQAQVLAGREGLKGKAYKARVAQLVARPTDAMAFRAVGDAEHATFQNVSALGTGLSGLARPFGAAGDVVLPFRRTPGAVAGKVAEYSPFGAALGVGKAVRVWRAAAKGTVDELAQKEAVDLLGRSTVGTLPLVLGYLLAQHGLATGAAPKDAAERDAWALEGRTANSVLINGEWRSLSRVAPLGNMVALGANLHGAVASEGTLVEKSSRMAFATVRTVADQPLMTGVQDLMEAVQDPEEEGARYASRLAGSVVPAGVAAIARGTDPVLRRADSPGEAIRSRIPGLSDDLPARVDALGGDRRRTGGLLSTLVDPTNPSADRRETDPIVAELSRLGVSVPPLKRKEGQGWDAHNERQRIYGVTLREALAELIGSEDYQGIATEAEEAVRDLPEYQGQDPAQLARHAQAEEVENLLQQLRREFTQYEKGLEPEQSPGQP
jgi:hypothetical protein